MEPEQEGVRNGRRDDPVLFHIVLVPEAARPWRLWCTWWVWAGPRSTRETHNVSFVINVCAVGTALSLFPFAVCCLPWNVEMIFVLGSRSCSFGRDEFYHLSFPRSLSLFLHLPILHLIRFSDFCEICGEFATKEWCFRRGWSEVIDTCKQCDQGNLD